MRPLYRQGSKFGNGETKFYIHPDNNSGDIPYYAFRGNEVRPCGPNDENPFTEEQGNQPETVTVQGASGTTEERVVTTNPDGTQTESVQPQPNVGSLNAQPVAPDENKAADADLEADSRQAEADAARDPN